MKKQNRHYIYESNNGYWYEKKISNDGLRVSHTLVGQRADVYDRLDEIDKTYTSGLMKNGRWMLEFNQ